MLKDKLLALGVSNAEIAEAIGVAQAQMSHWITGHKQVPVKHCTAIEKATKGAVTRQELRPNDYWLIWPDLANLRQEASNV